MGKPRLSDEEWVTDRMTRLVASSEFAEDFERILLEGMSKKELRAFCLGVRAGKHRAAQIAINMSAEHARATALAIDPFIK